MPTLNISNTQRKSSTRFPQYGLWWDSFTDPISMEMQMIQAGGQWTQKNGDIAGNGLAYHYRKFQELVWPEKIWEKGPFKNYWAEKCLEAYLNYTYIGVLGCAASGKSDGFGSNALTDWYCFPDCTTILVSSTDLPSLELRIWGMIKKYHKAAKRVRDWLPGHLIEGKRIIIQDEQEQFKEGRDFKNGLVAIPCKKGNSFVGIGSYVGIHNRRVRLLADECNLMPRAFLDSTSNLSKCQDFKLVGLGNPNETTNAHGVLCEPSRELGGWEGGMDQRPGTKTWGTNFPNGIALQLPGSDTPNKDMADGDEPPFPFLITPQQLRDDAQIWGVDDWHYKMMDEAMMPRGQGSRRILTRQACLKFGAFTAPKWRDSRRTSIAFLDAAYRGVGGDRCVFGELQYGPEIEKKPQPNDPDAFVIQDHKKEDVRHIICLIDIMVIPIQAEKGSDQPEDQIVRFVMDQCAGRGIRPENFYFDSGMRTSLVTAFSRIWTPMVNSVDCGGTPTEDIVSMEIQKPAKDYYSKFITELWYSVRLVVESGQFRGMTEEVCTEFSQREWKLTKGNKIEVETKEEMKLKTGRSPDLADAVAIGIYGARKNGFVIARAMPEKQPHFGPDWRDEIRRKSRALWRSGELNYQA